MATNQDPQGSTHSKQRLAQTPFSGAEAVRKIMENFAGIQSAMSRFGETLYAISASANKVDFEFKNLARIVKMGRSSYSGGGSRQGGQYSTWQPDRVPEPRQSQSRKSSSSFVSESLEDYEAKLIAKRDIYAKTNPPRATEDDGYEAKLIAKKALYDKINPQRVKEANDPAGLDKYAAGLKAKEGLFKIHLAKMNSLFLLSHKLSKMNTVNFNTFFEGVHKNNKKKSQRDTQKEVMGSSSYIADANKAASSAGNPTSPNQKAATIVLDLETQAESGTSINDPNYHNKSAVAQASILFVDAAGKILEKINHSYKIKSGFELASNVDDRNSDKFKAHQAIHANAPKMTAQDTSAALTAAMKKYATQDTVFAGQNHGPEGFDQKHLEASEKGSVGEAILKALNPSAMHTADLMLMIPDLIRMQGKAQGTNPQETELFKKLAGVESGKDILHNKGANSSFSLETLQEAFAEEIKELKTSLGTLDEDLSASHDAFADAANTSHIYTIVLNKMRVLQKQINGAEVTREAQRVRTASATKSSSEAANKTDNTEKETFGASTSVLSLGKVIQVEIIKSIPLMVKLDPSSMIHGLFDLPTVESARAAETSYASPTSIGSVSIDTNPAAQPIPVQVQPSTVKPEVSIESGATTPPIAVAVEKDTATKPDLNARMNARVDKAEALRVEQDAIDARKGMSPPGVPLPIVGGYGGNAAQSEAEIARQQGEKNARESERQRENNPTTPAPAPVQPQAAPEKSPEEIEKDSRRSNKPISPAPFKPSIESGAGTSESMDDGSADFAAGVEKTKKKKGLLSPFTNSKDNKAVDSQANEAFKSFASLASPILSQVKLFSSKKPPSDNVSIGAEKTDAFDSLSDNAQDLVKNFQRAFNVDLSGIIDFSAFKVVDKKEDIGGSLGVSFGNENKGKNKNSISLLQKPGDTGSFESESFGTLLHESIHAMFVRLRNSTGLKDLGKVEKIDTSPLTGLQKDVATKYNLFAAKTKESFIKTLALQNHGNIRPTALKQSEEELKGMDYYARPEEQLAQLVSATHEGKLDRKNSLRGGQASFTKNKAARITRNAANSKNHSFGEDEQEGPQPNFFSSFAKNTGAFLKKSMLAIAPMTLMAGALLGGTGEAQAQNLGINKKPSVAMSYKEREANYEDEKSRGFDSQKPYTGTVIKVIDGDTFIGKVGSVVKSFRTAENDAPESDQMYGKQSKEALQKLLPEGSTFRGVPEMGHRGREPKYNRPLATVYNQEGKSVAEEMVKEGLSYPAYPGHTDTSPRLNVLHGQASSARKGMFAESFPKETAQGIIEGHTPPLPVNWRTFNNSQKAEEWKKHQAAKARKSVGPSPEAPEEKGSNVPLGLGIAGAIAVGGVLATRNYNSRENQVKRRKRREQLEKQRADEDQENNYSFADDAQESVPPNIPKKASKKQKGPGFLKGFILDFTDELKSLFQSNTPALDLTPPKFLNPNAKPPVTIAAVNPKQVIDPHTPPAHLAPGFKSTPLPVPSTDPILQAVQSGEIQEIPLSAREKNKAAYEAKREKERKVKEGRLLVPTYNRSAKAGASHEEIMESHELGIKDYPQSREKGKSHQESIVSLAKQKKDALAEMQVELAEVASKKLSERQYRNARAVGATHEESLEAGSAGYQDYYHARRQGSTHAQSMEAFNKGHGASYDTNLAEGRATHEEAIEASEKNIIGYDQARGKGVGFTHAETLGLHDKKVNIPSYISERKKGLSHEDALKNTAPEITQAVASYPTYNSAIPSKEAAYQKLLKFKQDQATVTTTQNLPPFPAQPGQLPRARSPKVTTQTRSNEDLIKLIDKNFAGDINGPNADVIKAFKFKELGEAPVLPTKEVVGQINPKALKDEKKQEQAKKDQNEIEKYIPTPEYVEPKFQTPEALQDKSDRNKKPIPKPKPKPKPKQGILDSLAEEFRDDFNLILETIGVKKPAPLPPVKAKDLKKQVDDAQASVESFTTPTEKIEETYKEKQKTYIDLMHEGENNPKRIKAEEKFSNIYEEGQNHPEVVKAQETFDDKVRTNSQTNSDREELADVRAKHRKPYHKERLNVAFTERDEEEKASRKPNYENRFKIARSEYEEAESVYHENDKSTPAEALEAKKERLKNKKSAIVKHEALKDRLKHQQIVEDEERYQSSQSVLNEKGSTRAVGGVFGPQDLDKKGKRQKTEAFVASAEAVDIPTTMQSTSNFFKAAWGVVRKAGAKAYLEIADAGEEIKDHVYDAVNVIQKPFSDIMNSDLGTAFNRGFRQDAGVMTTNQKTEKQKNPAADAIAKRNLHKNSPLGRMQYELIADKKAEVDEAKEKFLAAKTSKAPKTPQRKKELLALGADYGRKKEDLKHLESNIPGHKIDEQKESDLSYFNQFQAPLSKIKAPTQRGGILGSALFGIGKLFSGFKTKSMNVANKEIPQIPKGYAKKTQDLVASSNNALAPQQQLEGQVVDQSYRDVFGNLITDPTPIKDPKIPGLQGGTELSGGKELNAKELAVKAHEDAIKEEKRLAKKVAFNKIFFPENESLQNEENKGEFLSPDSKEVKRPKATKQSLHKEIQQATVNLSNAKKAQKAAWAQVGDGTSGLITKNGITVAHDPSHDAFHGVPPTELENEKKLKPLQIARKEAQAKLKALKENEAHKEAIKNVETTRANIAAPKAAPTNQVYPEDKTSPEYIAKEALRDKSKEEIDEEARAQKEAADAKKRFPDATHVSLDSATATLASGAAEAPEASKAKPKTFKERGLLLPDFVKDEMGMDVKLSHPKYEEYALKQSEKQEAEAEARHQKNLADNANYKPLTERTARQNKVFKTPKPKKSFSVTGTDSEGKYFEDSIQANSIKNAKAEIERLQGEGFHIEDWEEDAQPLEPPKKKLARTISGKGPNGEAFSREEFQEDWSTLTPEQLEKESSKDKDLRFQREKDTKIKGLQDLGYTDVRIDNVPDIDMGPDLPTANPKYEHRWGEDPATGAPAKPKNLGNLQERFDAVSVQNDTDLKNIADIKKSANYVSAVPMPIDLETANAESAEVKKNLQAGLVLEKSLRLIDLNIKKIAINEPDKLRNRRLQRAHMINEMARLGAIDKSTKENLLSEGQQEVDEKLDGSFYVKQEQAKQKKTTEELGVVPANSNPSVIPKSAVTEKTEPLNKFQEAADPITFMEALGETANRLTGAAYGDKQKDLDGKDIKPIDYTKSFKNMKSLFFGSKELKEDGVTEQKSFDYEGTTVNAKGDLEKQKGTLKADSAEEAMAMLNNECGMMVTGMQEANTGLIGFVDRLFNFDNNKNLVDTDFKDEEAIHNSLQVQELHGAAGVFKSQEGIAAASEDGTKEANFATVLSLQALQKVVAILQDIKKFETSPSDSPVDTSVTPDNLHAMPSNIPGLQTGAPLVDGKILEPTPSASTPVPEPESILPSLSEILAKNVSQMGPNEGPQAGVNPQKKRKQPYPFTVTDVPEPATSTSNSTEGMDTGSVSKDTSSKNQDDTADKESTRLRAEFDKATEDLKKFEKANEKNHAMDLPGSDLNMGRETLRKKVDVALKAHLEALDKKINPPTAPKTAKSFRLGRQGTDNVRGRFKSKSGKIGTEDILVGENESIVTAAGSAANPELIAEMNRTGKPVKNFEKGFTPASAKTGFLKGVSNFFSFGKSKSHEDRKPTTFGGKHSSGDILAPLKVFGEQLQNTRVGFFAKSLLGLGGAATHAMNSLASFTKSAGGDTFNTLTGSIDLLMGAIGIQLTPLILRISMYIQNMATQIQNGTGVFGGIVTAVTGFINSISNADLKFLISLGMIAGGITALLPVFGLLTGALSVVATGISIMMGLFASPILLAVAGIGALVFAFGGFQGIINMICGVLNNYKTILTGVALLFGALAAVWLIANAPLILLAAAIGICVTAVMKAVEGFKNLWKSPGDKAAEKTKAEKDPGIGDKLKNFKMPDMSKIFSSIPGGADLAKEMGIDLPKDPTKPKKPKGYLDLNKDEKAKQDEEDKKKIVKKGGGPLTKDEEARNRELTIEKQDVEEKKEWAKKRLAKAEAQADPKDLKAGTDKDVNKEKEKIASADETIKNLDSMMTKPQGEKTTNAFEERKAHYATPEGKKEVADHDYKKKVADRDALGGQLAMSMKANRAQPAFSSVEEASKKIQISALGVDPLEAKQQLQAEQNLQKQLESYERLNASVKGVTLAVEKQQSK